MMEKNKVIVEKSVEFDQRLQALEILNKHFKYEGHFGCLEDRQVKLVLNAMIEFSNINNK